MHLIHDPTLQLQNIDKKKARIICHHAQAFRIPKFHSWTAARQSWS